MAVTKYEQVVLKGTRDVMAGLWRVNIQILDRPTHQSNHLHQVNGKEMSSSTYMRRHLSQYKTHEKKAVNRGYLNTCPGLTEKYINKMTKTEATIKGDIT